MCTSWYISLSTARFVGKISIHFLIDVVLSVESRPNQRNKAAFSNYSGIV